MQLIRLKLIKCKNLLKLYIWQTTIIFNIYFSKNLSVNQAKFITNLSKEIAINQTIKARLN